VCGALAVSFFSLCVVLLVVGCGALALLCLLLFGAASSVGAAAPDDSFEDSLARVLVLTHSMPPPHATPCLPFRGLHFRHVFGMVGGMPGVHILRKEGFSG